MTFCPSCSAEIPRDARFCSSCGANLDVSSAGTVQRTDSRPSSSGGIDHGRFVPGAMFGERYRIVALLGKGGMGEVYRADDLKLNQAVALKLLPRQFGLNEERRARLLAEVRLARQIAHANVCRVYDVGDIDGEHFISMEYVHGEDLATLLQRIGRFPKDKGIEIARQICAGLAAAHDRGVLHRDLKPPNIMLDERGRVRVTDFGLASTTGDRAINAAEGTPAYMAPEQLAGREVTTRSDIYALGLVLYELFTGRRAFSGTSVAELREQREQKSLTDPSRIVDDLDPAVERVILRCLENDPRDRPPSVIAVMASLPGGDPLAAAIAAGETPSPELLAASGDSVGLKPSVAVPLLLFVLLGSIAVLAIKSRTDLPAYTDLALPPEALALKAREYIRQFGYSDRAADSAGGFAVEGDLNRYIRSRDKTARRWEQLRTRPVVRFWYRDAPDTLRWTGLPTGLPARVTESDPPLERSGMRLVTLDSTGKLLGFDAVPEQIESAPPWGTSIDVRALFTAAGLDPAQFKPVAPNWVPLTYADWRAAWARTSSNDTPLRVEAAAYHGRLVSFDVVWPWTRPARMEAVPVTMPQKVASGIVLSLECAIVVGACLFARRNLSLGRGDRRGATRLSFAVFVIVLASRLVATTHTLIFGEGKVLALATAYSLLVAAAVWILYVACEPYMRRRWPQSLIGLGKILSGRLRDPHVGRDILIGSAGGVALQILQVALRPVLSVAGIPVAAPHMNALFLSGLRYVVSDDLFDIVFGVVIAFVATMLVLLFRILLRRDAIAISMLLVIAGTAGALNGGNHIYAAVVPVANWGFLLPMFRRFGVAAAAFIVTTSSWLRATVVVGFTGWAAYTVWIPLLLTLAVATAAFWISLAGRPLFREALLEA